MLTEAASFAAEHPAAAPNVGSNAWPQTRLMVFPNPAKKAKAIEPSSIYLYIDCAVTGEGPARAMPPYSASRTKAKHGTRRRKTSV